MNLEWCRFCRDNRPFAVLKGNSGAPDFNCCQICGDGYSIDPPPTEESA